MTPSKSWSRRLTAAVKRKVGFMSKSDYSSRVEQELKNYAEDIDVHQLPEIFHYWSNRYVRPWFEQAGTTHPEDLFAKYMLEAARTSDGDCAWFLSIGSGNCDAETAIASDLVSRGLENFKLVCLDINPHMLERGKAHARNAGVLDHLEFQQADFNFYKPDRSFDAVIANQCLHHVTELENLFDAIQSCLSPKGLFITSDMIGRNGHQRWPEALSIVEALWQELPDKYKFNHQMQRLESRFVNHDCSSESFEGIRAQDILPLLVDRFSFHVFIAFGNVVDIFIDRGFGHNFDATSEDDRKFIDRVHAIDEKGFREGTLTPTHMVAVMSHRDNPTERPIMARGLDPSACIRASDAAEKT